MRHLLHLLHLLICLLALCQPGIASAQSDDYPSRPIRIVVPFPAGGPIDIQARIIAQTMQTRLKSPVVVENRPGANQLIGANAVASAPADGYTLIYFVPALVSSVFVKQPAWDVQKAFTPVGSVWIGPLLFATNNDTPGKTLADFINHAKANRGQLFYGSTTGATYLGTEMFNKVADVQMSKIDYKGTNEAILGLMRNDVQAFFGGAANILVQMRQGKLRALAVAGDARLPGAPEVPTFAELGYPGIKTSITALMMAPAGTPRSVLSKLAPLIRESVGTEEMKRNLMDNGVPLSVEPDQLQKFIADEIAFWAAAAKATQFVPQN
jgi:tripartite-type tricarboxylate transporter receptor subunit TctC